ncbi:hypothetical protein LTR53_001435 [Teratosphaeriaceae sp. CCFEE 6253]|nr:hypothetical protein LTR53_001435 [Teratosphaeriaceae sp. CCFEE 6253]
MRIATLQFFPALGAVEANIHRANTILAAADLTHVDLLVLPELAFSGYNFPSLEAIEPFLEPTTAGISTQWAIATARRLSCHIIVGYPERDTSRGTEVNYNATVTVSPTGEVLANYRKSFLYYTDDKWAAEGTWTPLTTARAEPFFREPLGTLGLVGHGICMDINPYAFTAPWTAYEFATAMLKAEVPLVVLSMAWLTRLSEEELQDGAEQPDMATVAYWVERLCPLVESKGEVVVVFANRCGVESNVVGVKDKDDGVVEGEGEAACYAGSSCVMRFRDGKTEMLETNRHEAAIMGKGEEGVLIVDTQQSTRFVMRRTAT